MSDARQLNSASWILVALALLLFGLLLFKHASYPLMWQAEAATAMFGVHVLEYGQPKVYGELAAIYPADLSLDHGISDGGAFRGGLWGPYYAAAIAEVFAGGADDPWDRTGRLRGFFGLLGCAGIGILLAALLPVMGSAAQGRTAGAATLLLLAGSVSFILHLREVGPLGPTVLLLAAVLFLVLRVQRARIEGAAPPGILTHTLRLAPLLVLLGTTSILSSRGMLLRLLA